LTAKAARFTPLLGCLVGFKGKLGSPMPWMRQSEAREGAPGISPGARCGQQPTHGDSSCQTLRAAVPSRDSPRNQAKACRPRPRGRRAHSRPLLASPGIRRSDNRLYAAAVTGRRRVPPRLGRRQRALRDHRIEARILVRAPRDGASGTASLLEARKGRKSSSLLRRDRSTSRLGRDMEGTGSGRSPRPTHPHSRNALANQRSITAWQWGTK
jgi:hypothetical protein